MWRCLVAVERMALLFSQCARRRVRVLLLAALADAGGNAPA